MKSEHLMLLVAVLLLGCILLGCISGSSNLKQEWSKIQSFEALVTYRIDNKTYTSKIIFVKPNKALKEDITNGNITNAILIIGHKEIIVSGGKKFVLNATKSDLDALDPFIAILDNIGSFTFKLNRSVLTIVPENSESLKYVIKLNNNLPKQVVIIQQNKTLATAKYTEIKPNINININESIVNTVISAQLKQLKIEQQYNNTQVNKMMVFFFYSPYCPHCEEIKPYVTNLTKRYTNYKFVFCDVNNCNGTCKKVMEKYRIMFVPTIVVFGKNNTTILTGTTEIRNNLERVLNEG